MYTSKRMHMRKQSRRTLASAIAFGELAYAYQINRQNMRYRAIDAIRFARDPDVAGNMQQFTCQHSWSFTGSAYGGQDSSYHGEGRSICSQCGMDGDA